MIFNGNYCIVITQNFLMSNTWYGLYDGATDSQSLIMENYAFRNGFLNTHVSPGNIDANSINYFVTYTGENETLPLSSATVGGFGALNVATKFANIEWQVNANLAGNTSETPNPSWS